MIKKLSVGAWITCIAVIAAIVSVILYNTNLGTEGYFKNAEVTNVVLFSILAIAAMVIAIILKLADLDGVAGKCVDICAGVLQIAAPVLLALNTINIVAARVQGLGYIYFSNADVALEVQTPENLASASGAILSIAFFAVAMIVALVGAFCCLRKEAK
jgi:hypothetical protein